jgi:hypothetical protein
MFSVFATKDYKSVKKVMYVRSILILQNFLPYLFTSLSFPLLSYPINILGLAVLRGKIKEFNQFQNLSKMECEIMVLYETAVGKDMIEEIPALHKISLLRL